ncbi:hypothetical protein J8L88_13020 [Aquimarina sp. MMG015]|uniref:hypothetical protein n=1 Tax=Aquimarina TaxID=290174 RepID=UPI000422B9B0|nr:MULTISPECIES: hypothetical protein [Aquimarina]AXT56127.1 hypothetical protein D1815_10320 [Aquimarina sp. AD1]MBQ4803777.1 hypothetical protein [Aquimarina sp. MMG015]RKN21965.1 hypothetical protein D7035_12290 [Aquimarina sp. AD1]
MKLNSEQEKKIKNFVDKQGFKLLELRDDIEDHLCCVVESDLKRGRTFDQSLRDAISELAPNGLIDLERKTIFLLNSKRIIMMKKLMYFIGFIGALTLTVGVVFKILWYPGANKLFMTGFLLLLLIFVPMLAIDRYKVAIAKTLSERLKIVLGCVSGVIVGLSGLFKLMHWMGAEVLLLAGAFIFVVGYLPFLFFTMYRKSLA